jgi:hypothetical protein
VFGPEGTPLRGGKVYLGSGDDVVLSADYGEDGHYRFESIPAGRYDYLAVSAPLDGTYFPCLFVRKDVILEAGSSQLLDIAYEPPALPTPAAATVEAPPEMVGADGQKRSHFTDFTIYNPFDWTWERQRVMYRVEFAQGASSDSLCLYDTATHTIIPHQLTDEVPLPSPSGRGDGGEVLSSAKIHFFAQVAPKTRQIYRLYYDTHRGFSTTLGIRNSEFGILPLFPLSPSEGIPKIPSESLRDLPPCPFRWHIRLKVSQ